MPHNAEIAYFHYKVKFRQSWAKIRGTGHKITLSVNIFILHILNQSPKFLLSCLSKFWKAPSPQTMLRATGIIWTVDKHSIIC